MELVEFLERELKRREWKKIELARAAKLPPTTVYTIFEKPNDIPGFATLWALAQGLGVPFKIVVAACGYPIEDIGPGTDWEEQARAMVVLMPELRDLLPEILALDADDRSGFFAIVKANLRMLQANKTRKK